jgi:hypothetical protein
MAVERDTIEWRMDEESRIDQRVAVLLKWSEEESGDVGVKQRYRYNVESFSEAGVVYLHRPAFLNKGCDFTVHCSPLISRNDGKKFTNPRHRDLVSEILFILNETPSFKEYIINSIQDVYDCKNINTICYGISTKFNNKEISDRFERVLKVLKWLFIEQDITDWNTSGRAMLMTNIKSHY